MSLNKHSELNTQVEWVNTIHLYSFQMFKLQTIETCLPSTMCRHETNLKNIIVLHSIYFTEYVDTHQRHP